jgi:hypothetical protein
MANQKLNIDIVAKDRSKQALNGVQKSLGRLKHSVFNLRNAFLGLGAGLVVRNLVNTGKQLENLRTRLKFLLKDTNEGAKAFDNMTKFASKVPFSLEEIQAGAGILATVTDNADDLQKMLEITGNVASVTGLDFRTAGEQIQRSFSAGIGSADIFREKGVRNMLGFKAGATVSIEETVEAFERVFGKGGRFGKATDELANTFEGTLSMIGDKVFNFKKVILEAGFFKELKKQFGDLDEFLENNAKDIDNIAKSVGKNLAQGMVKVVQVGKDLIPTINKIGSGLKSILDGFMAMPEFAREVGIVGAFLLGKKGAVGLASISFLIDKIGDLLKQERIGSGLIDVSNIEEAKLRLAEINKQLEDGLQKELEFIDVRGKGTVILEDYKKLSEDQLNSLKKQKLELLDFIKFEKIKNGVLSDSNHHLFEMANNFQKIKEEQEGIIQFTSISNQHMFEMANAVKETQITFQQMNETALVNMQEKFTNIGTTIKEGLNAGITSFSMALSRALILGEDLGKTFKRMLADSLINTLAIFIEIIIRMGIQKLLGIELDKQEDTKLKKARRYTTELSAQLAIAMALAFFTGGASMSGGLSTSGGSMKRASGGSVQKDQPYMVGEQGAELFIPNSSGQITQSARGTGGSGTTNVNFNINATDVTGIKQLLIDNRATIVNSINSALNEKGKEALV